MILIGTAGHVDHGKSSLVEALTGIDPVHLPEERERGLTIELGFAHLEHPDGYTLGIVDVPGHEKLVRTMISGATGFGLALWVVDAREGLKPQSREHLEVLELLGAARVLPVITKADIADEATIERTRSEVEAALGRTTLDRFGTRVVDSVSGRGIDELREAVFEACRTISLERQSEDALPYMPIDRCFVLKGVGTVVTGTLVRGELRAGTNVAASSSPEAWRIRSLHNHKTEVETIGAGHRVGVHLHGARSEVNRGDILVSPDYPFHSSRINAELRLLSGRTFKIKHGTRALFLAASYEMECRLWGAREVDGRRWVQIQLPRETCFYPGQRFVLRSTNPLDTVGGGEVLDLSPDRLRRITDAEINFYRTKDFETYVRNAPEPILALGEAEVRWMFPPGSMVVGGKLETRPARVGRRDERLAWDSDFRKRACSELEKLASDPADGEKEWPLTTIAELLGVRPAYVHAFLEACLSEWKVPVDGAFQLGPNTLRFVPRKRGLSDAEARIADDLESRIAGARLRPERIAQYLESSRANPKVFDKVLADLIESGRLVRIDKDFVIARDSWTRLRKALFELSPSGVTPADFGRHFDLTRKFTMPYLECLNRLGLMRRDGGKHLVIRDRVERNLAADRS